MMRHGRDDGRERAGFTLLELVLAAGLLAILMIAVFALIDGSMKMWRRTEVRRNLTGQAIGVVELFARDLRALEGGERGDLLLEWVRFDTDGDELRETVWPRLRLVRQASPGELARAFPKPLPAEGGASPAEAEDGQAQAGPTLDVQALIEVAYVIVPMSTKDADARAEGLLYRGARRLADGEADSFFEPGFVRKSGVPQLAELDEVTGGVLWFGVQLATQTSIIHDGWSLGGDRRDAATSWDAWEQERPDTTVHHWNQPNSGMAKPDDRPVLPRRVRLEVEFERPLDRRRRPRTLSRIEATDVAFDVDDGQRLPAVGRHLKVGGEWMRVTRITGDRVQVQRAQRGTEPQIHDPGALVHWGMGLVREVPVELYREDWDL